MPFPDMRDSTTRPDWYMDYNVGFPCYLVMRGEKKMHYFTSGLSESIWDVQLLRRDLRSPVAPRVSEELNTR